MRTLALALSFALALTACDDSRPSSGGDGGPPTGDAGLPRRDAGNPASCTVEPVQSVSEPCCEAFGVDACGAGLFCAAFDGRTLGTCYALGSRLGGEECYADPHCGSGRCGAGGACAALPGEACTAENGCAAPGGDRYLCLAGSCQRTDGDLGDPCGLPIDCDSGYCVAGRCTSGEPSAACGSDADCRSGICASGTCSSGMDGAPCEGDGDCASGYECRSEVLVSSCRERPPTSCTDDAECPAGCFEGACVEGRFNAGCDSQPDCVEDPFFGELRCIEGRCSSPRESGEACTEGIECASGFCYPAPDNVCA